jgi:hypothetical protein
MQIEYEAFLDQVQTHTMLFPHGCVVDRSLQKSNTIKLHMTNSEKDNVITFEFYVFR